MSKESLFNILNNHFDFDGLHVLDLFSGTGNISYEFGSRGAEHIVAVDADFGCVRFIKQTAAEFDFPITAVKANVLSFLEKASGRYDIIFADPPYDMAQKDFEKVVLSVFEKGLLSDEGMMVIEHSKYTLMDALPNFSFQKNYGGSRFTFFELETDEDESPHESSPD